MSHNAVLPSLENALETLQNIENESPDKSVLAFRIVQNSGKAAKSAIPVLLKIIDHGPVYLRAKTIWTLGLIGPGASERETQTLMQIFESGFSDGNQYEKFLARMVRIALENVKPQDAAGVPVFPKR